MLRQRYFAFVKNPFSACLLLSLMLTALAGCQMRGCRQQSASFRGCDAIIVPPELLPDGWKMVPSHEMVGSDKTPWWTQNPQYLEDQKIVGPTDTDSEDLTPSRMWAALYDNGEQHVAIFCFEYRTREKALEQYGIIDRHHAKRCLGGFSKTQANAIVVVVASEKCQDWNFFERHFDAVTVSGIGFRSAPVKGTRAGTKQRKYVTTTGAGS